MRGIAAAFAMARPARSEGETLAVAAALAAMPEGLSARSRCEVLARRVVAELMRIDGDGNDLERALSRSRAMFMNDPVHQLVHDPDANLVGDLMAERMKRFSARNCQQLTAHDWAMESCEIGQLLVERFAARFRRAQKLAAN